jgi:hypothetical protein
MPAQRLGERETGSQGLHEALDAPIAEASLQARARRPCPRWLISAAWLARRQAGRAAICCFPQRTSVAW